MATYVLRCNSFSFDKDFNLQVSSTAMGSIFATNYASLYLFLFFCLFFFLSLFFSYTPQLALYPSLRFFFFLFFFPQIWTLTFYNVDHLEEYIDAHYNSLYCIMNKDKPDDNKKSKGNPTPNPKRPRPDSLSSAGTTPSTSPKPLCCTEVSDILLLDRK